MSVINKSFILNTNLWIQLLWFGCSFSLSKKRFMCRLAIYRQPCTTSGFKHLAILWWTFMMPRMMIIAVSSLTVNTISQLLTQNENSVKVAQEVGQISIDAA